MPSTFIARQMLGLQNSFDFRPANAARAHGWFAGMAEIRRRLGLTERDIREEIESLRLEWAFNFSASTENVFTRVYEPSLENWLNPKIPLPATLNDLVKKLFPAARFTAGVVDTISGVEFQEVFNLSCPNMVHLLDARLILCRDDKWSNGITPRIFLPSVVEFLKRRQLP